jgi:uncharacterized protein (DUF302 family)
MTQALVVVVSSRPFEDTLNALVASVKQRQVEVFGMIDRAANAQGAGLTLGRTTLVTFGGAKAGTPRMQAHQTLGLDLPLRALVYETAEGQVRIAYREPRDILAGQGVAPDAFPSPVLPRSQSSRIRYRFFGGSSVDDEAAVLVAH